MIVSQIMAFLMLPTPNKTELLVDNHREINSETTADFVYRIKRELIPRLFEQPSLISSYGTNSEQSNSLNEFSQLMEQGSVGKLSMEIESIIHMLGHADPQKIARPTAGFGKWLDDLMGKSIENKVLYEQARNSLDAMINNAQVIAKSVEQMLISIEHLIAQHRTEVDQLSKYIQAGREFLAEHPQATPDEVGVTQFDRPYERFARKLTNLATLEASHKMSLMQLKLTQAQAIDMLDRFTETTQVLIPVWRQHTLGLITHSSMSPEMMAQANAAHEALMKSLTNSLTESKN